MDNDDEVLSGAKLRRRIEELERATGGTAEFYTQPKPVVQDVDGNPLPKLQRQYIDAVWKSHPCDQPILIDTFKQTPDIIVDGGEATVIFKGESLRLPLDQVESYWVDSGHLIA